VVADRCAGASVARFIRCWLPADLSSDTNFFPHRRTLQAVTDCTRAEAVKLPKHRLQASSASAKVSNGEPMISIAPVLE